MVNNKANGCIFITILGQTLNLEIENHENILDTRSMPKRSNIMTLH